MLGMPSGMIVIWSGSLANIPVGFLLCDGAAGTPDLRDRFIIGASDTYHPRATGGAEEHTHDFITDGHTHLVVPGAEDIQFGNDFAGETTEDTDSGTTDPANHMPPYYALAYIIKT